ncbi:DNA-binding protein [Rosenbergiella epipactidis]|uniref:DNA-binding protein n=1 Tax=Rosenbergiella epipactidis TaxID=1544694 RepID=UPI001F4E6912|nr:DNA-binding protein [Rosenbergiella epipactidis]
MSLVSITEAARLTGKSRRTIQRYVATGKLSLSQSDATEKSIDISELIRVFGDYLKTDTDNDTQKNVTMSHNVMTKNDTPDIEKELLKQELALLKERLKDKDAHIDSLQKAMLLIELKLPKETEPASEPQPEPVTPAVTETVTPVTTKKSWQFWRK